jgi:amino acid transporter
MLTLAQIAQYEPVIIAILIVGLFSFFFGIFRMTTKKDKDLPDKVFLSLFIVIGLVCMVMFVYFVVSSDMTNEKITPCNIIQQGNSGGLVASVEGGTYSAYSSEMLKLHINQTREVLVLNEWGSRYSVIKEVPGVNCPSGAASRC